MTESEWHRCTEPEPMLEFVRTTGGASDRQLRLFAVACCRCIGPLLRDERLRQAVETAERHADGMADDAERTAAAADVDDIDEWDAAEDPMASAVYEGATAAWAAVASDATDAARQSMRAAADAIADAAVDHDQERSTWLAALEAGRAQQASLLKDIFNPFRQATLKPLLLPPDIIALASATYDQCAFDRMPELAGLLEAAGCNDAELLGHLHGPGPHVRVCWALDLLIGRG